MKKIMKKYKLPYYFKVARTKGLPYAIPEIIDYVNEHRELPFDYSGDNWVYDAICEHQKRYGVIGSQYFTPDYTVGKMLHLAGKYFCSGFVLEPCCGTGQITVGLLMSGYDVVAFDDDPEMIAVCNYACREYRSNRLISSVHDFRDYNCEYVNRHQIIANPPYEVSTLTDFLLWMDKVQDSGDTSILLLPKGFISKNRPKRTFDALRKFDVLETEDMLEDFALTKARAEIVVMRKI